MALLTVQKSVLAGTTLTYASANAGGDTIRLVDHSMLIVKNGAASPITVTVVVPGNTVYGLAQPDLTVSVAATTDKMIGPFDSGLVDTGTGFISITYSSATTVTVAHVQV